MASGVIRILSVTLGLFFIFVGILKICPLISTDLYKDMRKVFIRAAKVFLFHKWTGWRPNPHTYRKVVAVSEIISGAVLAFIPGPAKDVANVLMILLSCNEVYAHYITDEKQERMSLPLVFVLLLCCRLIITLQLRAQERDEKQKAHKASVDKMRNSLEELEQKTKVDKKEQ
ncbi:hypothetical protein CHS0354_037420 [Potamilus streckersoni]|uniref:Novel acetylcholine receptor chaperone n=1 Tax=Potamilus streckersoni TaxID=2493646 RepID=A0AAE0VHG7_9BIVA|nr:hypothetical protein CHS0354_037420 [Potamilus streckersoni]